MLNFIKKKTVTTTFEIETQHQQRRMPGRTDRQNEWLNRRKHLPGNPRQRWRLKDGELAGRIETLSAPLDQTPEGHLPTRVRYKEAPAGLFSTRLPEQTEPWTGVPTDPWLSELVELRWEREADDGNRLTWGGIRRLVNDGLLLSSGREIMEGITTPYK